LRCLFLLAGLRSPHYEFSTPAKNLQVVIILLDVSRVSGCGTSGRRKARAITDLAPLAKDTALSKFHPLEKTMLKSLITNARFTHLAAAVLAMTWLPAFGQVAVPAVRSLTDAQAQALLQAGAYQLIAIGTSSPLLINYLSAKSTADKQDVLSPLIEPAAPAIIDEVNKRK
jgi:hypothetical protein